MSERLYSESEVAAIIAQAAVHPQDTSTSADGLGLTLGEIERAGREAGLDPGALRAAAASLDAGRLDPRSSRTAVAEEWADGPLRPDAWEDAVAVLRLRLGPTVAVGGASTPDVRHVGDGVEWVHQSAGGAQTTVSASPRDGRTRVRVVRVEAGLNDARIEGFAWAGFLALVPAFLAGVATAEMLGMGDAAGVLAVVLVFAVLVGLAAPRITRRTQRNRESQAVAAGDLARVLARSLSGPPSPASEPDPAASPRLDLDALGAEPPAETPRLPNSRTRS